MITGCKDGWGSQRHERRTQSRTCERKQGRRPCQLFAHRDRGDRLHHRGLPRDVRDLPRTSAAVDGIKIAEKIAANIDFFKEV